MEKEHPHDPMYFAQEAGHVVDELPMVGSAWC